MTKMTIDLEALVRSVVDDHRGQRGPLLEILHAIQHRMGYVDKAVVPLLAGELNLSRADVHGVVSFYRDFRSKAAGRTAVRVCRAEACRSVGSEVLVAEAERRFATVVGETSADGLITLDQVFCLGNCALGPAALVNGKVHGLLDIDRLERLVRSESL